MNTFCAQVRGHQRQLELEKFIRSSAKSETNTIGFLPWCAVERYIERGTVAAAITNDDVVAWVVWGSHAAAHRVYQIFTRRDARRFDFGRDLMVYIDTKIHDTKEITCWCADDLESNFFWSALGFKESGHREGGRWRNRHHTRWSLERSNGPGQPLFKNKPTLMPPSLGAVTLGLRQLVQPRETAHDLLRRELSGLNRRT